MNGGRTCNICIFSCFRGVAVEESIVENETVTKVHLPLRAHRSNQAWIHEWLSTRSYGHTFDCNFEDRRRDALSARSFGGYAWVIFNYDFCDSAGTYHAHFRRWDLSCTFSTSPMSTMSSRTGFVRFEVHAREQSSSFSCEPFVPCRVARALHEYHLSLNTIDYDQRLFLKS